LVSVAFRMDDYMIELSPTILQGDCANYIRPETVSLNDTAMKYNARKSAYARLFVPFQGAPAHYHKSRHYVNAQEHKGTKRIIIIVETSINVIPHHQT